MATPSSLAASGVGPAAMRSRIESGTETRSSFFMNSALRTLTSGQIPATTGMRQLLDPAQKIFQQTNVEHRLGHRVFGSGLHFEFKPPDLFIQIGKPGFAPTPITKPVPAPIGFPPRSSPRFRL